MSVPVAARSSISIILPAKNEARSLLGLLSGLRTRYPHTEIIVVDDGSTDGTSDVCLAHDVRLLTHPYSLGNGAAIKAGARAATSDVLLFMDADGQHGIPDIDKLLAPLSRGYEMVVGARTPVSHAGTSRRLGNGLYSRLASLMTGHRVDDLTSGFRAVRADRFREFLHLLPNGFSYPTTITMAFFRSGYPIAYIPIHANKREGKSHIKLMRDGMRFLIIIFKIGTLYSPLKIFAPASGLFFASGLGLYLYTYLTAGRFTNMGAVLFVTAILVFLIGLVSEQITQLLFTLRRAPFRAEDRTARSSRKRGERRAPAEVRVEMLNDV